MKLTTAKLPVVEWASYLLAGLSLWLILKTGLLTALFAGLLVYSLIHILAPTIEKKLKSKYPRMIAVLFLSVIIIATISVAIWGAMLFLRSDAGSLHNLFQKLADLIEASRHQIPDWINAYLPGDAYGLRMLLTDWLHEHAAEAKVMGQEAGHIAIHLLLGMIIGSMVALQETLHTPHRKPFAIAMVSRVTTLAQMFHKVVFAQVRISLINTTFTALYLGVILPMMGVHLPLTKSMIAVTFIAGLIPVVGNIFSNTVIVIVSLSNSLQVAAGSLAFMVVIHKLEYFLNARIIGAQVNAKAYELLTAILVMETLFGLPGLVAAPVYYAYLKKELSNKNLV